MDKNRFIHSVLPSPVPKKYPDPIFSDKQELEDKLKTFGFDVKVGKPLKGGTVSQVYEGSLSGKKVVVKHVDDLIPFDPTEFFIDKKGLRVDALVLGKLSRNQKITVPKLVAVVKEINVEILEDLRENGFVLLSDVITAGKLTVDSASSIGKSLANLAKECQSWDRFGTNESAEQSIYERGLELRLAYPNSQSQYLFLEKEFTKNNQYFVWPDGHPKNIFVNNQGKCAFIDFGRSHWGDQRYMLPNFLAHVVIYCLAGYIEKGLAKEYLLQSIKAYEEILPVDEKIFCQYLGMEVFHRANGKWISKIETKEQKLSLLKFAYLVFDGEISSINKLPELF
ncbi:hypothetical protein M1328_00110 [Patescibacteria group bacterium]|nr:hypothetical protein [Patescibacteria group bacterium]